MIRLLILCAVFFPSAACISAAPKKGEVEVRFLAERVANNLGKVELANAEARSAPFDLPMNNLSAPQKAPARAFSVWSVKKNESLATVKLPEEGNSFIALLVTSPDKAGYTTTVIPYRDPKFKTGDIYFHNRADKPVLGYVGTAKFILDAGKSRIVTPKGAREAKFYDVALGVREEDGNHLLATTRWPESKNMRFYVFFFIDPKTKLITYRGVDEFVMPKKNGDGG